MENRQIELILDEYGIHVTENGHQLLSIGKVVLEREPDMHQLINILWQLHELFKPKAGKK